MKGRSCGSFSACFWALPASADIRSCGSCTSTGGSRRLFQTGAVCVPAPASEETEETPAELAWPEVDFTAWRR